MKKKMLLRGTFHVQHILVLNRSTHMFAHAAHKCFYEIYRKIYFILKNVLCNMPYVVICVV